MEMLVVRQIPTPLEAPCVWHSADAQVSYLHDAIQ
jgi:hypothetical protein